MIRKGSLAPGGWPEAGGHSSGVRCRRLPFGRRTPEAIPWAAPRIRRKHWREKDRSSPQGDRIAILYAVSGGAGSVRHG
ncbi:hypothetical protein GUJ93_ZPchr0015g6865 [Zizania palustris]|uniref:Uncharacterized protein n=1 Tax=Zizania palustris TaxID=103762 RepID=A0A8J5W675_ZIZPA|nr:hypothetical protein GUJ93_ZPchr0015g6865 [Zizania palustris]